MKGKKTPKTAVILSTARLRLREMSTADDALMLEILNDPPFLEFIADRGVRTLAGARDYIEEKILPSYGEFGFGFYIVELKESGVPIGMCGLVKRPTLEEVDVGFSILERFWGSGYATEAARALMRHGFEALGIPRIVGVTAPHNVRSSAVLEKLGLRFEKMIHLPGYGTETKLYAQPPASPKKASRKSGRKRVGSQPCRAQK
ncbi:MAG: GNAT family N-acetyltransferase [Verrucomicrobiota bacterium]|nr:GNAT family N-acetyltransferase [Verrucomicrobiota bacterium]